MALIDGEEAGGEGKGGREWWREREKGRKRPEAGEERRRKLLFCEQITNVVEGSAGSVGKHFAVHEKAGGH